MCVRHKNTSHHDLAHFPHTHKHSGFRQGVDVSQQRYVCVCVCVYPAVTLVSLSIPLLAVALTRFGLFRLIQFISG